MEVASGGVFYRPLSEEKTVRNVKGLWERPVLLAPMAGVTDASFRRICRRFGAGLTYSEMVSAKALSYGDRKTKQLLEHEGEHPFAVQLFGHEPEIMAEAAKYVREQGADLIDLNMGCPAPKIVRNGDGAALLKTPELCGHLVHAVKGAVDCPVTVKIRLGWEKLTCMETAKILEQAGADAICVHGRTAVQQYTGTADWEAIAGVKRTVSVPVIGNGDVVDAESCRQMFAQTACDAVMIGRAAMGNPWIFSGISGGTAPSAEERILQALEHTRMLISRKGGHIGILESRKHVCWYLKGIAGSGRIKGAVNAALSYGKMEELLLSFLETMENRE